MSEEIRFDTIKPLYPEFNLDEWTKSLGCVKDRKLLYHIANTKKGYIASWNTNEEFTFTHDPDEAVKFPLNLTYDEYVHTGELLKDKYECLTFEFVIYAA